MHSSFLVTCNNWAVFYSIEIDFIYIQKANKLL